MGGEIGGNLMVCFICDTRGQRYEGLVAEKLNYNFLKGLGISGMRNGIFSRKVSEFS